MMKKRGQRSRRWTGTKKTSDEVRSKQGRNEVASRLTTNWLRQGNGLIWKDTVGHVRAAEPVVPNPLMRVGIFLKCLFVSLTALL